MVSSCSYSLRSSLIVGSIAKGRWGNVGLARTFSLMLRAQAGQVRYCYEPDCAFREDRLPRHSAKTTSGPSECANGSGSDANDDGVAGIPPTLFTLSEAVDPWVKLVISENADGEIGSNCIAGPSRPAAGASSSPESLDERAASCKPGRATA